MLDFDNLKAYFSKDRFISHNGISMISATPEEAVCQMLITDNHLNAENIVQGGAIFTLADFTFAVAANADGNITVSLCGNISFIKPASGKYLTAIATRVSKSRSSCVYKVEVKNDADVLIAYCSFTGFIKKQMENNSI